MQECVNKWPKGVFFPTPPSDTMVEQKLSTKLSCCVRNEPWRLLTWTQLCGVSTFSRTLAPPLTLLSTPLCSTPMTVSWAWTCPTEDSQYSLLSFYSYLHPVSYFVLPSHFLSCPSFLGFLVICRT